MLLQHFYLRFALLQLREIRESRRFTQTHQMIPSDRTFRHKLTVLPWSEVKGRNFAAVFVTRTSRSIQERLRRHLSDVSVVTNDAGQ